MRVSVLDPLPDSIAAPRKCVITASTNASDNGMTSCDELGGVRWRREAVKVVLVWSRWASFVSEGDIETPAFGAARASAQPQRRRLPSSRARASPITAAFVAEGNCGEPLGGPVPSAAFAGERVV